MSLLTITIDTGHRTGWSMRRCCLAFTRETLSLKSLLSTHTKTELIQAIKQEQLQTRLNEVRDKLSAAASACRAASTHRSDTAKKLARFFESILPREMPVALPPLPVPAGSYINGGPVGYLPPPMMHPQDQQALVNYGMHPGTGFTPTSGFDFSNMGTLFDNNLYVTLLTSGTLTK